MGSLPLDQMVLVLVRPQMSEVSAMLGMARIQGLQEGRKVRM